MVDKLILDKSIELTIRLAKKGTGFVAPNPRVGCVILDKNNKLISTGYHKNFGGPHAEIEALNNLKDKSLLMGAHVIVSLEPCAHVGKTGSCAQTLSKLPIGKVTYGVSDPNPLVSGAGEKILKENGIEAVNYSEQNNSNPKLKGYLEI